MLNRGFDDLNTCVEYYRGNCSLAVSLNIRASSTQRDGVDAYKDISYISQTRSYSPRPSTPSQAIPRQLYRPSPSSLNQVQQTPSAPSQAVARTALSNSTSTPLSSSTAKILNLPPTESPSNGLFYERSQERSQGTAGTSGTASMGGDFVLVDRDEKEWVDNVWKGVRGKAGRVGL